MLNWERDQVPVLIAAYELMDGSSDAHVDGEEIAAHLGREPDDNQLRTVLRQLDEAGYIDVKAWTGGMGPPALITTTEKGLQHTMGWPGAGGDPAETLLRLLDAKIADPETDQEERTRLEALRKSAGGVSSGVLQGVLTAWFTHITGAAG